MAEEKIASKRQRVKPLSQEYIKSIIEYDHLTGEFRWKNRPEKSKAFNTRWAGKLAGNIQHGYRIICIEYIYYRAHALAWCYMTGEWPPNDIDHIDMNRGNNRFNNIRKATSSQNKFNTTIRSDNTSGYKGVSLMKGKYWRARIYVEGKEHVIGYFKTSEEAHESYAKALAQYHKEFGRIR